jgi:hypothetical protein
MELPYYPATPFLGIYLKECKSAYSRDTCTPMYIAKLWNQPSCPSTDEWIKNVACTHTHTHTHNGVLFSQKEE